MRTVGAKSALTGGKRTCIRDKLWLVVWMGGVKWGDGHQGRGQEEGEVDIGHFGWAPRVVTKMCIFCTVQAHD